MRARTERVEEENGLGTECFQQIKPARCERRHRVTQSLQQRSAVFSGFCVCRWHLRPTEPQVVSQLHPRNTIQHSPCLDLHDEFRIDHDLNRIKAVRSIDALRV
jgi:hypothetical protein